MEKSESYIVPAFDRGLKLIELLGKTPDGSTIPEMECLNIPPASLFRLLATLVENGYAVREKGNIYRLTGKMLKTVSHGFENSALVPCSITPMRELRDASQESAMLAILHGTEGVVIHQEPSPLPVKVMLAPGHHFPLHSAAPAKAMMAFLPPQELEELVKSIDFVRFTDRTIGSADELKKELLKIRESNCAFDMGDELPDLRCIASAIFDGSGRPCAAVWISGPASRLHGERMTSLSYAVKKAAEDISAKIQ